MHDLKPCPFCGGSARVQCKEHPIGNYYGMNATPEEVAEVWKRRVNDAEG